MNDASFPVPAWAWPALIAAVAVMLAVDLLLHRDSHVIGFREAAIWSGVWIAAGSGFGGVLWLWQGARAAEAYTAASPAAWSGAQRTAKEPALSSAPRPSWQRAVRTDATPGHDRRPPGRAADRTPRGL